MNTTEKKKDNRLVAFYRKHPVLSHIILILITGLLIVWFTMLFLASWTDHGETAKVPDVKNMTYEQAVDVLAEAGFLPEIADSVYEATKVPGTVLETWPRPGATVKPGREVFLTITSFQPRQVLVTMKLTNMDSRQALSYLEESLGISHVRIVSVPSEFPDLVIKATYNGKEIEPGTKLPVNGTVTLEIGTVPTITEIDDYDSYNPDFSKDPYLSPTPSSSSSPSKSYEDDEEASTSSIYD